MKPEKRSPVRFWNLLSVSYSGKNRSELFSVSVNINTFV